MPITDAETVISKLLTAAVSIPLVTFAAVVISQLINLILASIFISIEGGSPGHMIWGSAPLFDVWASVLIIMIMTPLWFSPFIGWLLFVSAWTKRSPLLTAFLPLLIVPMLEYFVLRTHYIANAINSRFNEMPLFNIDVSIFDDESLSEMAAESVSILALIDVGKFFSTPGLWVGLVVCGLFITAAIYVRRYRDDS